MCLIIRKKVYRCFFFFQAEDGIRDLTVTGVQTCALPICNALSVTNLNTGGTLQDSAAVAVAGAMDWQGGTLTGGGTLTVAAAGTLSIDNNSLHYLDGETLSNQGTATWTYHHIEMDNGAVL